MKIKEMEYTKESKTELLCKDKYKNYNYYVLNLGTHPTAYIEIPKEDKLYGKTYFKIYDMGCDIGVNGGLTYSSNELMGIKSENWFIGWDYAHCNDYYPDLNDGKKWTTEEIIDECKNAIDQIIDFENKKLEEEKKNNFTGWKIYQDGKEVCSMDCSIEEKKIPEKLEYYDDSIAWVIDDVGQLSDVDKVIIDKLNEIIDYLKSKGE